MGVLHGLQCGYLFLCGLLPGLSGGSLLCWCPFQALHGNLPSSAWSTSSHSFTDPGVCRGVSHTSFLVLFHWSLVVLLFLNYKSPEVLPLWAKDSAMPCGGGMESPGTGHVQPRAIPASHHRPPSSPQGVGTDSLFSQLGLVLSSSGGKWFVISPSPLSLVPDAPSRQLSHREAGQYIAYHEYQFL